MDCSWLVAEGAGIDLAGATSFRGRISGRLEMQKAGGVRRGRLLP
jgi:hypothetical protein